MVVSPSQSLTFPLKLCVINPQTFLSPISYLPNNHAFYSPQYELLSSNEFVSLNYEDRQKVTRPTSQYLFTTFAAVYMIVDISWLCAVWSAASVGKS